MALASSSRNVGRSRALNSSSFSPFSGRNCHWLRNSAVSLRNPAMSSSEMPLTTCEPTNGGMNTSLSSTTSGERVGMVDGSTASFSPRPSDARAGTRDSDGTRPQSGSSASSPRRMAPSLSMTRRPSNASLP